MIINHLEEIFKMSKFIQVCEFSSLTEGVLRAVDAAGHKIVLIRDSDQVFALKDQCSHEEFPLSEGWYEDGRLFCAFHGAKFDPQTGAALSLPAYEAIATFPVRVRNGMVEIEIE